MAMSVDLTHPPPWYILLFLGAIVGAVVGLIVRHIPSCIYFAKRYVYDRSGILGAWHAYHLSFREGKLFTVHSIVTIKTGFKSRYVISISQSIDSELKYKGTLGVEKNHLVVSCKSVCHCESVSIRFPDPIGIKCQKLYGLWLAYDHDGRITSGAIVLSRDNLSAVEQRKALSEYYEATSGRPIVQTRHP